MRILAFLFLFLVFGESSFGCRCRPNRNLETLVFQAKNIFIGRVAEIREASVVFEVVNVLKGGANKKIEIFNESGSCDFFSGISDSAIGQSYLVFARKLDKELLSQKCWGSETFDSNSIKFRKLSEVSNALSEIQELKRGVPRSWVENKFKACETLNGKKSCYLTSDGKKFFVLYEEVRDVPEDVIKNVRLKINL